MGSTTRESARRTIRKPLERVACRAYSSAGQSNLTGNTFVKLALNAVTHDLGKNFSTALNRFVVPVNGLYEIKAQVEFDSASVIADRSYTIALYVNGVAVAYATSQASFAGALGVGISDEFYLEENDYVEVFVRANVGGGVDTVDTLGGSDDSKLVIRLVSKEGTRQ